MRALQLEVRAHDAVPRRAVLLVELGLDVLRDLHLRDELLDRISREVVGLLLHLAVLVHCAGGARLWSGAGGLSLVCVTHRRHRADEHTQSRGHVASMAWSRGAVLWGVALRPSRPSSALAVRVERRLAHRRVAGPRKLGTRRPDGRVDTPTRSSTDAGGGRRAARALARRGGSSARAHDQNAVAPTQSRGRRGVAAGPARRRPQRAAAAPSQSLVIRRRPVLSVMVVASRPFDMVPDGLRAQSGQLFGGRGLLYGGRGARWAA